MTFLPTFQFNTETIPTQLEQKLQNARNRIHQALTTESLHTFESINACLTEIEHDLEQFWNPIAHLHAVSNTPALRACYETCLIMLSDFATEMGQHQGLYQAIERLDLSTLSAVERIILENKRIDFKLSGVHLSEEAQTRFQSIQTALNQCMHTFEMNLLDCDAQYQYWVYDAAQLNGLPEHTKENAAQKARDLNQHGWCFTLDYPCYLAVQTYADHAPLREALYYAYQTRATPDGPHNPTYDNTHCIEQILTYRQEEARLLGYRTYAELSFVKKMAKSPEEVFDFLNHLCDQAFPQAQKELESLQHFAHTLGHQHPLKPWDIAYFSEKKKQQQSAISDEILRPYFPLEHVLKQINLFLQEFFGIQLSPYAVEPPYTWHPKVRCYTVIDEQDQRRGYIYLDLLTRPMKRQGAWMDHLRTRHHQHPHDIQMPIATLTCNFTPQHGTEEGTLTHDELVTLFHELGHCLHHVLSTVDHYDVSGIHGVEWDAVELPSQFFENFAWDPMILKRLSAHTITQAPLPEHLCQALLETRHDQAAMRLIRQIELALFDLSLHHTPSIDTETVQRIKQEVRSKTALMPLPSYHHVEHGFSHIFAGGYAAGYYSYLWAELLSCDAFERWKAEPLATRPNISREFRHEILEMGGSRPAIASFLAFRKRPAIIEPLLEAHGIHMVK